MAGASFDPPSVPLARQALPTYVCRFDGGAVLPNIRCTGCRFDEGVEVGQATFRYVFDRGGAVDQGAEWPASPEEVIGPDAIGDLVVQSDDRLLVYALTEEGDEELMFDGFATIPAASFSTRRRALSTTFVAQGAPIRLFDQAIFGRLQRDADKSDVPGEESVIHEPVVFNPLPRGKAKTQASATLDGQDATTGDFDHPCFLDPVYIADQPDGDELKGRLWTVPMAVKYLCARWNTDEEYVKNPDFDGLDSLLDSRTPVDGQYYDSADPSTYTSKPVVLKEVDVTGMTLPDALNAVLYRNGFRFHFELEQDGDSMPVWRIVIGRLDDNDDDTYQQVFIQDGGDLDPGRTNVMEMHLVRDRVSMANEYEVELAPTEYEVSMVLEPLYQPAAADCTSAAAIKAFDLNGPSFAGNEDKYRLYGIDECGEGHWNTKGQVWSTEAPSLKDVLGGPDNKEELYVRRRRPASSKFLTKDASGDPKSALLLISWDYAGKAPGLWDGTGTWFEVSKTWRMDDDRFGIYINTKNPEAWHVNNQKVAFGVNVRSSGGIVKGISAQAKASETRFYLMLTATMTGDRAEQVTADKRDASPTRFTIRRIIDSREDYKQQFVTGKSWFNRDDDSIEVRSDVDNAKDDATSRRAAHEMPRFSGPIVIPRLSMSYGLGDRITDVAGRGMNLRTNAGDSGGEGPLYPRVVGIEYAFSPEQSTTLKVTDDRGWKRQREG